MNTAAYNLCIQAANNMNDVSHVAVSNGHQLGLVGSAVLLAAVAIVMIATVSIGVMLLKELD